MSPKYLSFGLFGSGMVGLLACWLIQDDNQKKLIPDMYKSTNHNLAELSSNNIAIQSSKKIEDECGEYIWNSSSTNMKNSKEKNLDDYTECEKRIDEKYYPTLIQ